VGEKEGTTRKPRVILWAYYVKSREKAEDRYLGGGSEAAAKFVHSPLDKDQIEEERRRLNSGAIFEAGGKEKRGGAFS